MDPITGAALIGAAGQIGGSLFGARAARKNVNASNRAQRELAAYAFNRQVEMWNMQNQYNSPKAQMARLKEAGLNPHLMYGQGTVGNAQQMPQYHVPQQDYRGRPSVLGEGLSAFTGATSEFLRLQQAKEQLAIEKINADIAKNTKWDRISGTRSEAQEKWYKAAIAHAQAEYADFGLDNAETLYKILFQKMINDPHLSHDQVRNILATITASKEILNVLKSLGFGSLIGNLGRKNTPLRTFPNPRPTHHIRPR